MCWYLNKLEYVWMNPKYKHIQHEYMLGIDILTVLLQATSIWGRVDYLIVKFNLVSFIFELFHFARVITLLLFPHLIIS